MILFVVTINIGAILIKMFTLETEVELVQTIALPELPETPEFTPGDYRQIAVSVDGKVLRGSGVAPAPTASTAKMILALAVMEKRPFSLGEKGEIITITPEFYQKYLWYTTHNGSFTSVINGEEISQYDALASVLLASSNNMADSLAIWAFGNLDNYRAYASEMLERYGIKNTTIGIDASGYSETTTATAEDLAVIAVKLLENPVLKEIVGLKSYTVPVAGQLKNTNQILGEMLNGATVIGIKTGYIGDVSGYNLISGYEVDGHYITLALMGASTRNASFTESKNTLLEMSAELTPTTVVKEGEVVGYYRTWWSGRHDISAKDSIAVLAPESSENTIKLTDNNIVANINGEIYTAESVYGDFPRMPSIWERFLHVFGWSK